MSTSNEPLRLAILDDYASVAPKHFQHLPNLKIDSYSQTLDATQEDDFEKLVARLQPYQLVSSMRERTAFPARLLEELPKLKYLLTTGARNASIDVEAAKRLGITVTGTTGGGEPSRLENYDGGDLPPPKNVVGADAVNQHAWALLLALCGRIATDDALLRLGPGDSWQSGLGISLGGKTIGLVGMGRLGGLMARTAALAFGMRVIAWSTNLTQEKADKAAGEVGLEKGRVKVVGKEELFRQADVVSLHLVLSERSRGIVGDEALGWMKSSALLVNTSRGGLIDEAALLKVVKEGGIRGAALDVFWTEPLPADSPWRKREGFKTSVVLSPHMGYVNGGTINRWYEEQAENLEKWMKGEEVKGRIA